MNLQDTWWGKTLTWIAQRDDWWWIEFCLYCVTFLAVSGL